TEPRLDAIPIDRRSDERIGRLLVGGRVRACDRSDRLDTGRGDRRTTARQRGEYTPAATCSTRTSQPLARLVSLSAPKGARMTQRMRLVVGCVVAIAALAGTASADITVTKARIGCLDIQTEGNLTPMVATACDHKMSCSFKAPTESAYKHAGVVAKTRSFCTQ